MMFFMNIQFYSGEVENAITIIICINFNDVIKIKNKLQVATVV